MSQAPLGTRLYRSLIRPLAFAMDPEKAHYRTMGVFGFGLGMPGVGGALRRSMDPGAEPEDAVGSGRAHVSPPCGAGRGV